MQKQDYLDMVRYSIEQIKAHGNALKTDFSLDNTLVQGSRDYDIPFHEVSTSLLRLFEISDTVTKPQIEMPAGNLTDSSSP